MDLLCCTAQLSGLALDALGQGGEMCLQSSRAGSQVGWG